MIVSGIRRLDRSQVEEPGPLPEKRHNHSLADLMSRREFTQRNKTILGDTFLYRITGSDREKQMEANLQGIGEGLGNLKGMANQMNAEINRQNNQLDVIQQKVGCTLHLN